MTFKELCDKMSQIREAEKITNPVILWPVGQLVVQIYANSPLQFNIYRNWNFIGNKAEPDLKFWGQSPRKGISVRHSDATKMFGSDDSVERLIEEFPGDPHVKEIVDCLLHCT